MDDKKCIHWGHCSFDHMECEEHEPHFKCPDRATESPAPSGQAELVGCATELAKIADELQGLAGHIREYIAGDMPTLPMLWDIEEVVINYKKVTRPE